MKIFQFRFFRRKPGQLVKKRSPQKKVVRIAFDKRQKFVISALLLSFLLFFSEFRLGGSGLIISLLLSLLTDILLWWAIRKDIAEKSSYSSFILPFFYTLAFSLFYFLIPARLLSRGVITILYGVGLYSLFLCQNIFLVGSIRTIALLSGARIVSFILTLLAYFFISNIVFTLHMPLYLVVPIIFIYTYPLIYQSIWTYTLQKVTTSVPLWVLVLTLCILEVASLAWFWPSNPTVIALFLTGFFYTLIGLSHVWFEKRLFRGVLWEYVWVGVAVFFVLILFTSWGK